MHTYLTTSVSADGGVVIIEAQTEAPVKIQADLGFENSLYGVPPQQQQGTRTAGDLKDKHGAREARHHAFTHTVHVDSHLKQWSKSFLDQRQRAARDNHGAVHWSKSFLDQPPFLLQAGKIFDHSAAMSSRGPAVRLHDELNINNHDEAVGSGASVEDRIFDEEKFFAMVGPGGGTVKDQIFDADLPVPMQAGRSVRATSLQSDLSLPTPAELTPSRASPQNNLPSHPPLPP